jgi:hypothetical protein
MYGCETHDEYRIAHISDESCESHDFLRTLFYIGKYCASL